jgi:hypothetical protein
MKRIFLPIAVMLVSSATQVAFALTEVVGHVTQIEATYMPSKVTFQLDAGSSSCPAGNSWLQWANTNGDSVKSVYALILSAVVSGNAIDIFLNDGDITCTVQFIHLRNYH